MEELREEVGGRESQEEAGEELVKVAWTCGKNRRGTVDEESRFGWRGRGGVNKSEGWGSGDGSETGSV